MPDDTPDTAILDNPGAAVMADAIRQHRAIRNAHARLTNELDAEAALLATVGADVEQAFREKNPKALALQRWVLAFLPRLGVQVEAAGLSKQ